MISNRQMKYLVIAMNANAFAEDVASNCSLEGWRKMKKCKLV